MSITDFIYIFIHQKNW